MGPFASKVDSDMTRVLDGDLLKIMTRSGALPIILSGRF